jgi:hypothetical protein
MPSIIAVETATAPAEPITRTVEMEEQQATENIVSLVHTEEWERKKFMGELNKFMAEIGKPLSKIPIMGYKELDLFQLFREVVSFGGFNEVVKNVGTWSKIWKRLSNFDPSITDSSFRLKKNYERYLLEFEYKSFPEHRKQAMEFEKHVQAKRGNHSGSDSNPSSPADSPVMKPKTDRSHTRRHKRKNFGAYQIPRERSGLVKLPLMLGELTIESLGNVIAKHPYVTEKHLFPIGFVSTRYFSSMINPERRVKYTSQIVDGGDRPQFVVTAADEPINPIVSNSPSGAWRTVLKRVMGKGDQDKDISVSGALRFGLAHPVVSQLLRELPNADKCDEVAAMSLLSGDKKRSFGDFSDSESSDEMMLDESCKRIRSDPYDAYFSARDVVLTSREEIDALESAVATLQALKYCSF